MEDDRARQAMSFGDVAGTYDEVRPGYPDALVEDVVAAVPGARDIVDIGCGTGKASVLFARRGLRVVGVEPSPAMAAIALQHLGGFPGCRVSVSRFEDWDGGPASADLVTAAQAWHWLDPDIALPNVAQVLRRPGCLAIFTNTPRPDDTTLGADLDAVYRARAPALADASVMTRWSNGAAATAEQWPLVMIGHGFDKPEERHYDWTRSYSTEEYLKLLSTHSDHRLLPPDDFDALLDGVASVIEANGGLLSFAYRTVLLLTRPQT